MTLLLTVAAVFIVLLLNEAWWRRKRQPGEISRKTVHIGVGSFVAFWPFFLSWPQIIGLSIAFFVVVCVSKYFKLFAAIHSVQRPTWGEVFFAIAVGAVAMITHSKGIYAVALLQMSLADGMAAIVGQKYGGRTHTSYRVFGSNKSLVGTLTFFVISLALLVGYVQVTGDSRGWGFIVALSAATSLIENIGVAGLDNLLVPLLVATMLTYY